MPPNWTGREPETPAGAGGQGCTISGIHRELSYLSLAGIEVTCHSDVTSVTSRNRNRRHALPDLWSLAERQSRIRPQRLRGIGQKLNSKDAATSDCRLVAKSGISQRSYCTLPVKRSPGPAKMSAFTATSFWFPPWGI